MAPHRSQILSLKAYLPPSFLAIATDLFSAVWGFAPLMLGFSSTSATPDNTAEEPRGSYTRCFCQHSFPHRPSPTSFVTVNRHQSCWIMIWESQNVIYAVETRPPPSHCFLPVSRWSPWFSVLAPLALALQEKQAEFSSFKLQAQPRFYSDLLKVSLTEQTLSGQFKKPFGTNV